MKPLAWAFATLGIAASWGAIQPDEDAYTLIVTGDTLGYLAPCGCTTPMSGGIQRRASAILRLGKPGKTIYVDNGSQIEGRGQQDVIKAETVAQAMRKMHVAAINLGLSDARLGPGSVITVARLSGDALTSGVIEPSAAISLPTSITSGPFVIAGAAQRSSAIAKELNEQERETKAVATDLVQKAADTHLRPILLFQGPLDAAEAIAREFPQISAIVYSSSSNPEKKAKWVGNTVLVSPGERGKYLIRLDYSGGRFSNYHVVSLGPDYSDDPSVKKLYSAYLSRVTKEKLLDKLPRTSSEVFVGPDKCASCHEDAYKAWHVSKHAMALKTLEASQHDRDPDCVKCHVTGLESSAGFRSRSKTPNLAAVTCESCHGSASAHIDSPQSHPMTKVGQSTCMPCHTGDNSPNFYFLKYWGLIHH